MTAKAKYQRDMERWDNNELGNDEAFAAVAEGAAEALDEALNLQLISIRLQKGLIEALKSIAKYHGVGYQPMVRDLLSRFARAELQVIIEKQQSLIEVSEEASPAAPYFQREAA